MDGWMDGWMDIRMYGWMIDGKRNVSISEWVDGR